MFNTLIVSDCNFSKNLIASAYLVDLGSEYFTVECASFEPGPLNPLVSIIVLLQMEMEKSSVQVNE